MRIEEETDGASITRLALERKIQRQHFELWDQAREMGAPDRGRAPFIQR